MRPTLLLRLIVVGIAVLYIGLLIGFTVVFADDLPAVAWVGFGVVGAVVAAIAIATILLFERIDMRAGLDGRSDAERVADGRYRLLVVADVGCEGSDACPLIAARVRSSSAEVLVVAPTIASPLQYLMNDLHAEQISAGHRVDEILSLLRQSGVEAQGMIGSDLPLQAIQDALAVFPADEIVILAPPPETSSWSEGDLVERARAAHSRPVTHFPVVRSPAAGI